MEQHIDRIWKEHRDRQERKQKLEGELHKMFGEANTALTNQYTKEQFTDAMQKLETNYLRAKRAKLNKSDFEVVKKIGNGGYGVVSLVRKKTDHTEERIKEAHMSMDKKQFSGLYAMKTLRKSLVFKRSQTAHVIAEKDILSEANNDWIVKLHYSFQVS